MGKWKKIIPVLLVLTLIVAVMVVAISAVQVDRDKNKEIRAMKAKAERAALTSSVQRLSPKEQAALEAGGAAKIGQPDSDAHALLTSFGPVDEGTLPADVAAKLAMEAEIQAKIEAEEEGGEEEIPLKAAYSTKDNEFGTRSIAGHPVIKRDPGTVLLTEDFEAETFPPVGWDTINTDPGYGFFRGIYSAGTYAALVTWHASGYIQDEWLLSPVLNVSGAGSDLKLEFWMLKGYTWPHDFKVYVDDGSGFVEIWDSYDVPYPTFEWYAVTIDLSGYAGGPDIQLGFQYYGEDADLFGIDDINVNDEAPQPGRCCYGDPGAPDCADNLQAECDALSGTWTAGLNCTDNPCPVAGENDDCADVTPDALPATWIGNNEGATYDTYCQWFGEFPNVWHAFTIEECMDITIEYCPTAAGWGNAWLNLITDCDCPDGTLIGGATFDWGCANGNARIYFSHLEAGTYYYPVLLDPGNGAVGDYELYVYGDPCPEPTPGDNCSDPFVVTIGGGDLPYTIANQYTCGRLDNYNETCLGSYDGGEDLIVELNLSDDMTVNITLDPKGTTYSGMGISAGCPDDGGVCIGSVTSSSGSPKTIPNLVLTAGTYYIIVDTYPTPDCIPDLDIIIEAAAGPQPGDNCDDPLKVDIPSSLPWCDNGQTTCGRGNYYEDPDDDICMGYYTNGEDIFYEITVLSEVTVNFHLDPKGTSYAGMGLFSSCPPTLTNCIDFETSSSSSPKSMTCVSLEPGVYYLMIDTWSTPYCIPEFDLCIVDTTCEALENDDCADAQEVGEVENLAFSTDGATFDGSGTCQSAPNIWYCYTAGDDGIATISLCGSGYDTKLAAYDGCTCDPLGTELGCNDDAPCDKGERSVQSELEIAVQAGHSYLVEVGGYGTNTGSGILNIWVSEPCVVECPPGAFMEPEDCGDDANGGCNMDVPAFTPIECEDTVCGTIWADGGTRDTDWYELVLTQATLVTWSGVANFPFVIGFVDTSDCNLASGLDPYATGDPCDTISCSRICGPGTYWLFASHQDYDGYPCGTFNDYWAAVSCQVITEGACCYEDGSCQAPMTAEACDDDGGTSWLAGQDCGPPNPCPQPGQPGDNCLDPLMVDLSTLPWSDVGQTTCGRLNDYDNTCLDYYDGGEDIIYEITVLSPVHVEITLDPKGTTWTGVAIATDCPPTTCLATSTSSSGDPHGTDCISLDPGVYYIMVDTWPSPDCIAEFDLHITECEPCDVVCSGTPEGEPCINDNEEDVTNGGCNSEPPVWGTIDCDETVCGEWNTYLFGTSNYRDTDWYKFTLTQCSDVTITAVGEFPIVFGFLEQVIDGGGWDCSNFTGYISPSATGDECDTIVVQRLAMTAGDYAIFVGGQVFTGFGCALGTFEYSLSVDCVPAEPTYCEASGGCDEYIERVEVGTIDNTSVCEGYGDFTALSTDMVPETGYPITITTGNGYSSDTGAVWVDWNQDLDFNDPGEVASLDPGAGTGPYSGTVTVPADALPGETRMRIRLTYSTDPTPCGAHSWGEVEDYTINVSDGEEPVTYLFEPDPVLVLSKFTVDPMSGFLYLSSEAVGGDVNDMTNVELKVGDCVVSTTTEIITGGYGELTGDVMKLTFDIKEYIECEEDGSLIWDEIESFFDVYYDMGGTPSQMSGQVTMIGHISGDLNLDGKVNVSDVTYFVSWLFSGGPPPTILELGDVNGSGGNPNISDLTHLVNYLFKGGSPPMHK